MATAVLSSPYLTWGLRIVRLFSLSLDNLNYCSEYNRPAVLVYAIDTETPAMRRQWHTKIQLQSRWCGACFISSAGLAREVAWHMNSRRACTTMWLRRLCMQLRGFAYWCLVPLLDTVTAQVVVMVAPVCVTQQTIKLLRFNFNFRRLYYVSTLLERPIRP